MTYTTPRMCIMGRPHGRIVRGGGMGSVLLNRGGTGSGSSYVSPEDYTNTTGRTIKGEGLGGKLSRLMVKPLHQKKTRNITF